MDAWRALVAGVWTAQGLTDERVRAAMEATPRSRFVPPRRAAAADTEDHPLPIGGGQTVSAPHMVAIMSEALAPRPGERVLEVGSGCGFHAAVTAQLVGPQGIVHTIEYDRGLAARARRNLEAAGVANVEVHIGDGFLGLPTQAPFDAIYATCACPSVPAAWRSQLRTEGRILLPLGAGPSQLVLLEKNQEAWTRRDFGPCAFVPLRGVGSA